MVARLVQALPEGDEWLYEVKLALGARSGDVPRLVLTAGLKITALGVAIGLGAAVALMRFLAALLKPLDPITFLTVPAS